MNYISLKRIYHIDESKCTELYKKRFESEATRHLGIKLNNLECFYTLNDEILTLIGEIYKISSWFDMSVGKHDLPSSANNYIIMSSLIEEIRSSNEIEGVFSTRRELQEIISNNEEKKFTRFYGMVNKYQKIISESFPYITTSSEIRKLYDEILLKDVIDEDENDAPDGVIFRKNSVEIGSGAKTIHKGISDEKKIIEMIDKSLKILNNEDIHFLIRIAIFHYLFEYIHPFYNGNGRMGRFLASGYLSNQLNILCAFQLSIACLHNKKSYYEAFEQTNDIRNKSDLTVFLIYFLEIYLSGLKELKCNISSKSVKYKFIKEKLDNNIEKKYNKFVNILLEVTMFRFVGLTMAEMVEISNLSQQTIRKTIKRINKDKEIIKINKENKPYLYEINIDIVSEL